MDLVFNTFAFEAYSSKEVMYDDKPGLMDVPASAAILGIACTQYAITTFIHRSALKSHRTALHRLGRDDPSGPRIKTRWLAAFFL
jgi:hypothetical protein